MIKLLHRISCIALMLLLVCGYILPVYATDTGSLTGNLTLVVEDEDKNNSDIKFNIWQVDPAVENTEDIEEVKQHLLEGSNRSASTDSNGKINFTDLHAGKYYAEQIENTEDAGSIIAYEPFLVDVPRLNGDGQSWERDVVVYLKHTSLYIDKFVGLPGNADYDFDDVQVAKNEPVSGNEKFGWSIESYVPRSISKTPGTYTVSNRLTDNLHYYLPSIQVFYVPKPKTHVKDGIHLTKDVDYKVVSSTESLDIVLTPKGKLMAEQNECRYLLIKFDSALSQQAPCGVDIYDGASVSFTKEIKFSKSYSASGNSTVDKKNIDNSEYGEVANKPEVHQGKIKIVKLDESNDKKLKNAEFGLAKTKEDALLGKFITTNTTNQLGVCEFKGLSYGMDGDHVDENSNNTTFWLSETKAPQGYKRVPKPVEIKFNQVMDKDNESYFAVATVYDVAKGINNPIKPGEPPYDPVGNSFKTWDAMSLAGMLIIMIVVITMILYIRRAKKNRD